MPQTAEGLQKFLNYWLYGCLKTAGELGNTKVFMRTIEQEALGKFIESEARDLQMAPDAETACRAYMKDLDRRGIMDSGDLVCQSQGDQLRVQIGAGCPYRRTCDWIHEEGAPVHCFRAVALSEMLRITLKQVNGWTLDAFGVPCTITLKPLPEVDDDGR